MTSPVFIGDPAEVRSTAAGASMRLDGPEARHAVTVMRVAVGESIDVVDGAGTRVHGRVAAVDSGAVIDVDSVTTDPEPPIRVRLIQALAKGDRSEHAVEAATELGVDAVVPWQADRSVVRWRADKAAKGQAKWQSLVRAATKQSRRSRLADVSAPLTSNQLTDSMRERNRSDLVLILHECATTTLSQAIGSWQSQGLDLNQCQSQGLNADGPTSPVVSVIVGPEGGIDDRELRLFEQAGAVPVLLGPHVLRASTAGPAALALLNYHLGRW